MSGSVAARVAVATVASLAINLLVFGISDLLGRERPAVQDITDPVSVQLVKLPAPEPPEPEREPPPEDPPEKPRLDFTPQLAMPSPLAPDLPAIAIPAPDLAAPSGPALGSMVFLGTDLDEEPRAVVRTPPPYPYRARQRRVEGSVRVKLLVGADGSISDVSILEADPEGYFEDAVLRTVPGWRFSPGRIAGQAVASWVVTTVRFDMEGG
jgi:protein TonB